MIGKLQKTLVLPDIHVPNHCKKSLQAILKLIHYWRPDHFIQLGDACDFDSLSRYDLHNSGDFIHFEDEVRAINEVLDVLDKALGPSCKKYLIGGNHEDRYMAAKARSDHSSGDKTHKAIKKFTHWAEEYNLDSRGWKWCNYGEWIQIGKIIYTHGWASGSSSCLDISRRFPGKNVLFGHTHQHLVYGCMDTNQKPIEIESIGTLSRFDLSYLRGKPPYNWTRGFSAIYSGWDGQFTKQFIHVIDGRFYFEGKEFKG